MNYIGSKHSLLNFLDEAYQLCDIDNNKEVIFCDIFAGTGRVGRHFKKRDNISIIANDMESYSYSLINHYIKNHTDIDISKLLEELNSLQGIETGFIFNNYCPSGNLSTVTSKDKNGSLIQLQRQYFSDQNGKIIDEARQKIDIWLNNNNISEEQYRYLLASILEASDKVANTASVYGAFLKKIKKTADKKIIFTELPYEKTTKSHETYNQNANELVKNIKGTVLYLDPPYNQRQYGANYHILNTIAEYDNPDIRGVTGMRNYIPSEWCRRRTVKDTFEQIINDANFEYILFSYNSESLMLPEEIAAIMNKYGEYSFIEKEYNRFKADNNSETRNYKTNKVIEYVHILKK